MSNIVLQAQNISKLYHLGAVGSGSMRRDMQLWWEKRILQKEDIFPPDSPDYASAQNGIWSLKNINLEVSEGESWGIIGRNGAGKSTFLKVLSRIIKPTTGVIRGRGKISSLLEVGTGFHPELTGRENIFISGHMLGMNKAEIIKKFDEIVDFSGVEKFIDTPVKRYSSGMYVRLAFAVAAHLEPDILIVDEVLAVGDAEFQKKCLGKMKDATTKKGRTVIFVSHNLQSINNLCTKALWLDKGLIRDSGDAKIVINNYLSTFQKKSIKQEFENIYDAPGNDAIRVTYVELIPNLDDPLSVIDIRTDLTVRFRFYNTTDNISLSTDLILFSNSGECIFDIPSAPMLCSTGFIEGECTIPGNFLNDGSYYLTLHFSKDTSRELYSFDECLIFDVADFREENNWYDKWWGMVRPNFPLFLKSIPAK